MKRGKWDKKSLILLRQSTADDWLLYYREKLGLYFPAEGKKKKKNGE